MECPNTTAIVCATSGKLFKNLCEFENAKCSNPLLHIKKFGHCGKEQIILRWFGFGCDTNQFDQKVKFREYKYENVPNSIKFAQSRFEISKFYNLIHLF